jgi:flagellar hook-length control protein FliK
MPLTAITGSLATEDNTCSLLDKLGGISPAASSDDFSQVLDRIRQNEDGKSLFSCKTAALRRREQDSAPQPLQESARAGQNRAKKTVPAEEASPAGPLAEFFAALDKKELGRINLRADDLAKLEELLMNSGYSQTQAEDMLKLSLERDNSLNLDTLAALVADNPPQGGTAFMLEAGDQPLFIQVMQDLGVSPSDIDNYLAAADHYGDKLLLRGVNSLLAQVKDDPAAELSPAAAGRLQNLLGKLGLEKGEIETLLNAGPTPGVNAKSVFLMLEHAARQQDQQLTRQLREIMLQSGGQESRDTAADAAARLRAQLINTQQYIENRVGKNSPVSEVQAVPDAKADSGSGAESLSGKTLAGDSALAGVKPGPAANRSGGDFPEQGKNQDKNQNGQKPAPEGAGKILAGAGGVENVARGNAAQAGGGAGVLPAYVVRQVAFSLGQMAARGLDSLHLSLKPPSLGEISMELALKDGAVKASLVVESVAAKKALEAGMDNLKQNLAAQGVKVQQIEISVHPDAQRRQEQAFAGSHQQRRRGQGRQADPEENNTPAAAAAASNGLLSVRA